MIVETVITTCDMCDTPDADEMRYGLMGKEYALDLCSECREHFGTYMAAYLMKSRNVTYRNHSIRRDKKAPTRVAQPVPGGQAPRKRGRPRKVQPPAGT